MYSEPLKIKSLFFRTPISVIQVKKKSLYLSFFKVPEPLKQEKHLVLLTDSQSKGTRSTKTVITSRQLLLEEAAAIPPSSLPSYCTWKRKSQKGWLQLVMDSCW